MGCKRESIRIEETSRRTRLKRTREKRVGGKLNFARWFRVKVQKLTRSDSTLAWMKLIDRTRTCFRPTFRDEILLSRYRAACDRDSYARISEEHCRYLVHESIAGMKSNCAKWGNGVNLASLQILRQIKSIALAKHVVDFRIRKIERHDCSSLMQIPANDISA